MDQNTTTYYRRSFPYLIAKLMIGCSFLILQVACNTDKEMADITPVVDPVDTTVTDQDTTVMDSIIYEDAPIWLPGNQTHGFASGKKNGKDFEASVDAGYLPTPYDSLIGFFLFTYSPENYLREVISIGGINLDGYKEYGMYPDSFFNKVVAAAYGTAIDGGDVLGDIYYLDTLASNQLTILSVEEEKKEMEGTFSASFIFDDSRPKREPRNPDYCIFENVYFKCKIIN